MIYHVHFDQKRIEKVVLNRVKELCLQRTRSMLRALQPRVFLSKLEHGSAALRWYSINATTVTEPSTSPAQLLLQRFSVPLSLSPSLPLSYLLASLLLLLVGSHPGLVGVFPRVYQKNRWSTVVTCCHKLGRFQVQRRSEWR